MPNTIASMVAQIASSSVAGIRSFKQVRDRLAELVGDPELELQRVAEISGELHRHGIVEAERFADLGALGGRGVDGDDLVDRIAGEPEHRKRDDPDRDHDADGLYRPGEE